MSRLSKVFDTVKSSTQAETETTKELNNESKNERNNEIVNLNFKVDVQTRRKIRQYAAKHDKSLKEVFEDALNFYIEHHP